MNLTTQYSKFFRLGLWLAIIPFILISFYNFPAGYDDFHNALIAQKYGELGSVMFFYREWTGRYTLTILLALFNPIKYGFWSTGIKIAPILIFMFFVFSAIYLIKAFYKNELSFKSCFYSGLILLLVYLFSVPTTADIFYWFSGACTYASGLIFFMLSLGGIIRYASASKQSKEIGSFLIAVVCLIAAIGTNESILMGILFLCFVAFIYAIYLKSNIKYIFLLLFFIALICSLISILAPGNSVRTANMHGAENVYSFAKLLKATFHSLYFTTITTISWINNFVLILFTILFIQPILSLIREKEWLRRILSVHPLVACAISIVFLSVQSFPAYLGMSDVDLRVWSSIYFFFLLSWFFVIAVCVNYWITIINTFNSNIYGQIVKFSFIFLLLFSGKGNISQAWFDLFARAPKYHVSLQQRYDLILNSKNTELIVSPIFERIYLYPKTIFSTDITTDVEDYTNKSVSEYFNLKSIKLKNEPVR